MVFQNIPILRAAGSCGIQYDRNVSGAEVRAQCPFCNDSRKRLYLNTERDVFHCHRCKKSGNSITLYAEINGISNAAAYRELVEQAACDCPPLPFSQKDLHRKKSENVIKPLEERSRIYSDMLQMLELLPKHRLNLQNRGLDMSAIKRNGYRSVPKKYGRLYSKTMYLLSGKYDLSCVPGFYRKNGRWHMAAMDGFFIPVRDAEGQIQGLQIRLDNGGDQKYKWFSSNGYPEGTKCSAFLHVVNGKTGKKTYITEGALKADTAFSLMGRDVCLIALPGVGSMKGLDSLLQKLNISELTEAFDMDKDTNPAVQMSVQRFYELMKETGVAVRSLKWNPAYKGIDDRLLAGKRQEGLAA